MEKIVYAIPFLVLFVFGIYLLIKYLKERESYSAGVPVMTGQDRYYEVVGSWEDFANRLLEKGQNEILKYKLREWGWNCVIICIEGAQDYYGRIPPVVLYRLSAEEEFDGRMVIKKELLEEGKNRFGEAVYDSKWDEFLYKKTGAIPIRNPKIV